MNLSRNKEFTTLKFPLRWIFEILNISIIVFFIISFFNKRIIWDNPNDSYSLIFVTICAIEIFSIIYLLRNKTFYYVDKANSRYLIKRKQLTSDEQRETSEGFIIDHYRFDDKTVDILNALDIILSLPSNKGIQKQIKNKVLTYPKYQIKKIELKVKILFMNLYSIEFENNKKKLFFIFNNLEVKI